MKTWQILLLCAALLAALGLAGNADLEEAERQRAHYCEMVDLYHETDGEYGWPPYNGNCEDQ